MKDHKNKMVYSAHTIPGTYFCKKCNRILGPQGSNDLPCICPGCGAAIKYE